MRNILALFVATSLIVLSVVVSLDTEQIEGEYLQCREDYSTFVCEEDYSQAICEEDYSRAICIE